MRHGLAPSNNAPDLLNTRQAADYLGVSHTYLLSLLRSGDLAHKTRGRHQYTATSDLIRWKTHRDERRAAALSELATLDADLIRP